MPCSFFSFSSGVPLKAALSDPPLRVITSTPRAFSPDPPVKVHLLTVCGHPVCVSSPDSVLIAAPNSQADIYQRSEWIKCQVKLEAARKRHTSRSTKAQ